ncbi:dihydrolipoyl dehydrogenase [bacterium]|nr:dihydrolipoyl dehydrogenase [bacterium]
MKLVIIGGGPGGYTAAIRAAQLGMEVTLVEEDKNLGGTCLNRGCIPTKIFAESAARRRQLQDDAEFGIELEGAVKFNAEKMQERKNSVVRRLAMGVSGLLKKNGVRVVNARGRLLGEGKVEAGEEILEADRILLATGSRVFVPPVFPADGEKIVTSDDILQLRHVPESLIVVGSGAVGMEFACVYAALGAKVSVVEMLPRLLPLEDEEVSAEMLRLMRKAGFSIYLQAKITEVKIENGRVSAYGENLGAEGRIEAEMLLAAVGRRANLQDLGLENAGLEINARGRLEVNKYMQTAAENIYAIGDIIPGPQLAHMAAAEGILAVEHMTGLPVKELNFANSPAATYSHPEVASVGLTQRQAEEAGLAVKIGKFPFAALGKAAVGGHTDGFVKIVAEAESGRILGAHIIGCGACDLIGEASLAVENGLTLEEVKNAIHPHPGLAEAIAESVHHALGTPLNFLPPPPRRSRR